MIKTWVFLGSIFLTTAKQSQCPFYGLLKMSAFDYASTGMYFSEQGHGGLFCQVTPNSDEVH